MEQQLKQIYDEIIKLKYDDSDLCSADLDDIPDIEWNKAIDECLKIINKYLIR